MSIAPAEMVSQYRAIAEGAQRLEKAERAALIRVAHHLAEHGYSVREAAAETGISRSVIDRALKEPVPDEAEHLLHAALTSVAAWPDEAPPERPSNKFAHLDDVVLFDIMREECTALCAELLHLIRTARAAHDHEKVKQLQQRTLEVTAVVNKVDPLDRDAQAKMIDWLRSEQGKLQSAGELIA